MSENTIQRIKQYIDFKGIRVSAFEREVGMSNGSFASQLKSNKTIGVDKLENILKKYPDINLKWLLKGVGNMLEWDINKEETVLLGETVKKTASREIPIYDTLSINGMVDLLGKNEYQKPIDFVKIPKIMDCDGALFVNGDGMSPFIKKGDIVVYKKIINPGNNIIWGEMHLVCVNNDGNELFFIRFLNRSDRESYVKLVTQNENQQTIEFPISSITALALVKGSVRVNSLF